MGYAESKRKLYNQFNHGSLFGTVTSFLEVSSRRIASLKFCCSKVSASSIPAKEVLRRWLTFSLISHPLIFKQALKLTSVLSFVYCNIQLL